MDSEKLEVFNKELENIEKNQTKLKNTITEIKNTLEESIVDQMRQEWISRLEDRVVEITKAEQIKEFKNEDSIRKPWDNIKHPNICNIGVQNEKGERKAQRTFYKA